MDNRRIPAAGERYRHFKGGLYQVAALARHSETGEQMVVYQALYGDFGVYVRPLAMFMDEVDREKYPESRQRYRFERVEAEECSGTVEPVVANTEEKLQGATENRQPQSISNRSIPNIPEIPESKAAEPSDPPADKRHAILMEFLDADTSAQKLNILRGMRKHIDDKMVHDMAVSLDIGLDEKPLEEQIMDIENCLKTYARFECGRLR